MKVPMLQCQMRLMLVWVIGSAILLVVVLIQELGGHYLQNDTAAIAWLLPFIIPTVSLVTGVWANNTMKTPRSTRKVERNTYYVVLAVSLFYLIFLGMVFAIQPLVSDPQNVLKVSGLVLSPLQGVVSIFLGIFFTQEPKSKAALET